MRKFCDITFDIVFAIFVSLLIPQYLYISVNNASFFLSAELTRITILAKNRIFVLHQNATFLKRLQIVQAFGGPFILITLLHLKVGKRDKHIELSLVRKRLKHYEQLDKLFLLIDVDRVYGLFDETLIFRVDGQATRLLKRPRSVLRRVILRKTPLAYVDN